MKLLGETPKSNAGLILNQMFSVSFFQIASVWLKCIFEETLQHLSFFLKFKFDMSVSLSHI